MKTSTSNLKYIVQKVMPKLAEEEEILLHTTYQPNIYYVSFMKLPKEVQKKLEDTKYEIEKSSYTVGKSTLFVRTEVDLNGKRWDAELTLGSVDVSDSDYKYDTEQNAYVDDQGREVDADEYAEHTADELYAVTDLDGLDVYLTYINAPCCS